MRGPWTPCDGTSRARRDAGPARWRAGPAARGLLSRPDLVRLAVAGVEDQLGQVGGARPLYGQALTGLHADDRVVGRVHRPLLVLAAVAGPDLHDRVVGRGVAP